MVATAKCEHVLQEVLMLHFKSLLALLFCSLSKLRHLSCLLLVSCGDKSTLGKFWCSCFLSKNLHEEGCEGTELIDPCLKLSAIRVSDTTGSIVDRITPACSMSCRVHVCLRVPLSLSGTPKFTRLDLRLLLGGVVVEPVGTNSLGLMCLDTAWL